MPTDIHAAYCAAWSKICDKLRLLTYFIPNSRPNLPWNDIWWCYQKYCNQWFHRRAADIPLNLVPFFSSFGSCSSSSFRPTACLHLVGFSISSTDICSKEQNVTNSLVWLELASFLTISLLILCSRQISLCYSSNPQLKSLQSFNNPVFMIFFFPIKRLNPHQSLNHYYPQFMLQLNNSLPHVQ